MVAPVVAAVAPTVIASATDDQGLINQGFKLVMIIGLALSIGIGLFLIYQLTGLIDTLGNLGGAIGAILPRIPIIGPFVSVLTFTASAFGFGGRN